MIVDAGVDAAYEVTVLPDGWAVTSAAMEGATAVALPVDGSTVSVPGALSAGWTPGVSAIVVTASDGQSTMVLERVAVSIVNTSIDEARRTTIREALALRDGVKAAISDMRSVLGTASDAPGTDTLRAIKATSNSDINASPARYIKALDNALIDLAQAAIRLARLAVIQTGRKEHDDDDTTQPTQ